MLIIFRCTVRHNFEPVRLVPGAFFKYPTPGAWFESQHHQFFGLLALVLACFGAGGFFGLLALVDGGVGAGSGLFWRWWMGGSGFLWRWALAVGEVHGESILVLVFACFGRFCAKC